MRVLGLFNNKLCLLIDSVRIIIQVDLADGYNDVLEYGQLEVFTTWIEVEEAAFGPNEYPTLK
jgi:hypothetical protein